MNKKNQKKLLYLISFLLPFMIAFIGLVISEMAPFGDHNILSAGNHNDFIPYVYDYYDHVRSGGRLFFGNLFGLGYDFSGMASYYFSDPTNLIILLFPRSAILSIINLLYALKIGLAGLSMSVFLMHKKESYDISYINYKGTESSDDSKKNIVLGFTKEPSSPVLRFISGFDWIVIGFSCVFALATTMITVGSYVNYLTAIAILPLIVTGMDKLICSGKVRMFIIFLFISAICNIHITIITFIFLIIYFFTREYSDTKHFLISLRRFIVSLIITGMLSCIPVMNSFQGEFLKKDLSYIFPGLSFDNPFNSVSRLASFMPISYHSVYGNGLDIAFGIGALFLVMLYIFNKDIKLKTRLINLSILLVIFSGTFLTTFRYLFNGLSVGAGKYIHFSYIMVFFCIMLGYEALYSISTISTRNVVLAFISIVILFIGGLVLSDMFEKRSLFLYTFELIFACFFITILYTNKSMTRSLMLLLLTAVMLIEGIPCYLKNLSTAGNGYMSHSLQSTNTFQIYDMSRQIHKKYPSANVLYYLGEIDNLNPVSYIFSGYDYIVSQNYINTDNGLLTDVTDEFINNSPFNIGVYRIEAKTEGAVFSGDISAYSYDSFHPFSSSNIFTSYYAGGKEVFTGTYMDYTFMNSSDGEYYNANILPYEKGDYYIFIRSTYNLGQVEPEQEYQAVFRSPDYGYQIDEYKYQAALFDKKAFLDTLDGLDIVAPGISEELYNNQKATVTSDKDGFISTGLPLMDNYNYYVNGKKVEPVTIFDNNVLLPVSTGENSISIEYSPRNLIIEIIITIIGLFIYIGYRRTDKHENENM